jgi:hypothetical protein
MNWEALVKYQANHGDRLPDDRTARESWQDAHWASKFRSGVLKALYWALGFTLADITLCFLTLPFVPRIICSHRATGTILALAIGLGISCLGLYARLILVTVGRPRPS